MTPPRPRACVLSLTGVTDEPRVRRQCQALIEHGWTVTVVGYPGASPCPEGWRLIELEPAKYVIHGPPSTIPFSRMKPDVALEHFWRQPGNQYIFDKIQDVECDLAIAHDYFTVPIAARLAESRRAPFVVDCHEYARAQFPLAGDWRRRLRWTLSERPYIDALQARFLSTAAVVTTVCQGIAELLRQDYGLAETPTVVRSTPNYAPMPFRPCGETIDVLYHGLVVPSRGMESAIDSVSLWRPEFRLVIRGVGDTNYLESLRRRSIDVRVDHRVSFVPPVPFVELVNSANACDIGYVVLENFSPQRTFTLPNKFFEYIMAGLALCVSDLPELARIVRNHDLGVLVPGTGPQQIAATVNSFTRENVNEFKRRSLRAAQELCWENEARYMIGAYIRSVPGFERSVLESDVDRFRESSAVLRIGQGL